jgi:hypothetical protein
MNGEHAVLDTLRRLTPQYADEDDLQVALAYALAGDGVPTRREYHLDRRNRIDLYIPFLKIGIEVKIKGRASAVIEQLTRYASFDEIRELILVTTRSNHHHIPHQINGKPVHLVTYIEGGL